MAGIRERLDDLLTGRDARQWSGSVGDLLYESEQVESSVDLGNSRVVVTGHRVLVFTPESEGGNFRAVDRPNVTDVHLGAEGDDDLLYRGLQTGLYAVVLLAVGLFVDFGAFLPTTSIDASGAGRAGIGGIIATMNRFLALFARLDDLMLTFGALGCFLAAVVLGVYLFTRNRLLVVDVAGDDPDVRIPAPEDTDSQAAAVDDLDAALFSTPDDDAAGPGKRPAADGDGTDRSRDARFKSDGSL